MKKGTSAELNLLINILRRLKPSTPAAMDAFRILSSELLHLVSIMEEGEPVIEQCDIIFKDGNIYSFSASDLP